MSSAVMYDPSGYLASVNRNLIGPEAHKLAVDYLAGRGVGEDLIKRFGLGYSEILVPPNSMHPDQVKLHEQTFKFGALKKTIIMPMRNSAGVLSGLVMRATPWSGFKFRYRIFTTEDGDKYGALYGLHQASDAIIADKTVYVVEGAMDALALSQVLPNTVAALTASLNERQAWVLSMMAENLVVVFDSDGPGVQGADKVVESYKPLFKRVDVKTLPYKDASETLGKLGLAKFRETVAARVRLTNFGKS